MGYSNVKEQVAIASAAIGLLERDSVLANTVWRDAAADFRGKKDDTISVRLPAYAVANKRTLRANATRVRSTLYERKVDITLDADLQVDVPLTDENQTLDVQSIVRDITAPSAGAIIRAIDEEIADTMDSASYQVTLDWGNDPYSALVDARVALDDHNVPDTGRFLVVGTEVQARLLKDELLVQANTSGSTQTLRRGVIGQVASFDVIPSNTIAPDVGYAYHRTAFALAARAPVVPQGVAWGASMARDGFAIRVMQHLTQDDSKDLLNIVFHDTWIGVNVVKDNGAIDENGKFVPSVNPDEGSDLFVRAVAIGAASSS